MYQAFAFPSLGERSSCPLKYQTTIPPSLQLQNIHLTCPILLWVSLCTHLPTYQLCIRKINFGHFLLFGVNSIINPARRIQKVRIFSPTDVKDFISPINKTALGIFSIFINICSPLTYTDSFPPCLYPCFHLLHSLFSPSAPRLLLGMSFPLFLYAWPLPSPSLSV